ncbi:hypothetical protein LTR62_000108 [Meristemomyces frigidus]|uniref:thioredoxin-dependent peroxiredoxin n=1 Tax=Meristemomyces frigidus TaxID=1508187 RepID=A0AAN7YL10_9PEZI|nr:hypothetical protein LTR62_000108 [Meristemomyces frigidus]
MSLATQLAAAQEGLNQNVPAPIVEAINKSRSDLAAAFDEGAVIKPGATLPSFTLPDAHGNEVTSKSLLAEGPILITFYRGDWCPFCNLALRDLQKHHAEFQAKGVTLVAISPQLPDGSLSMTEKHDLSFVVLSDVGNKFARQLGIVHKQPETLRPMFELSKMDFTKINGDESLELPIPATFLVDGHGKVRKAYAETDFMKRLGSAGALKWVDEEF